MTLKYNRLFHMYSFTLIKYTLNKTIRLTSCVIIQKINEIKEGIKWSINGVSETEGAGRAKVLYL